MTAETPNLHVSKILNISKTKQDIEKLETPLSLVWKCCSVVFKIGSKIFSLQWHFKSKVFLLKDLSISKANRSCFIVKMKLTLLFDSLDLCLIVLVYIEWLASL